MCFSPAALHTISPNTVSIKKSFVSLPYYKNLSEKISKLLRSYNINCSFRIQLPLKILLWKAKPCIPPSDILGIDYEIPCKDCDSSFLGETGQSCNIRLNEHRKAYRKNHLCSKLVIHSLEVDHKLDFDNVQILVSNCRN